MLLLVSLLIPVASAQKLDGVSCATDPTYQYLEAIQRDAYQKSPDSFKFLQVDQKEFRKGLANIVQQDSKNSNILGLPKLLTPEALEAMQFGVSNVKLHTCLEDPAIYFMIQGNVNAVELARRDLGMRLSAIPKYGSLPTMEVNAYTYYDDDTKERVIGFNNELFRFAFVETELAVATIPKDNLHNVDTLPTATPAEIMTQFFVNPQWRDTNSAAVRSFLHIQSAPVANSLSALDGLDQGYARLAMPLLAGMLTFAVGHEYGHVINQDQPAISRASGDSANGTGVPAMRWTWPQELAADEVGTRLTAVALSGAAHQDMISMTQWLYALRGAVLFMNCLQIVDDAKFMQAHDTLPPKISETQKDYIRQLADGKITAEKAGSLSGIKPGDYPPPWLRAERIRKLIFEITKKSLPSSEAEMNGRLADAIVLNMEVFWAMSKSDIKKDLEKSQKK